MEHMILQDICKIYDCPHTTAKDEGIGIPLVRTPNVGKGRLNLMNVHRVNSDIYKQRTLRAIPEEDDIIIAREAPVGNAAIIQKGQKVCLGQRVVLLKTIKDLVDPNFLVYYLLSNEVQHQLRNHSNGAVVAHLNVADIRNLPVNLPTLNEQKRIGRFLKKIDDKISVNKKICENLEAQAQALFKHWFIDFAPFKDGKFVESELGMIPEGWRVTTIGKVCKCELGGTPSRANKHYWGGNIAWINSGEVNKFRICQASEYITEEGLNHSATKILPAKTTVLAITGATLGQVSLLEIDSCANQSVVGITENEQIPYTFIYPLIKSRIKELMQMQTGGAQQHINKGNIQDMRIVLCPKPILSEYHSITQELFGQIGNLCFENLRLSTLRNTLLPRLMSGQIKL